MAHTDKPVYTYDPEKKVIREKATMDSPDWEEYMNGGEEYAKSLIADYKAHLASRKKYPAIGFTDDFAGRDLVEGEDFEIQIDQDPAWQPSYSNPDDPPTVTFAIPLTDKPGKGEESREYRLMIYFVTATIFFYDKGVTKNKTVKEFREDNEELVKVIFDEGLKYMNYELSWHQMDKGIAAYLATKSSLPSQAGQSSQSASEITTPMFVENLMLELFDYTPGIGYEVIKKEYENPAALYNWIKSKMSVFIAAWQSSQSGMKWVKVEDGLPENGSCDVFVKTGYRIPDCIFDGEYFWKEDDVGFSHKIVNATHWMKLPPSPTTSENLTKTSQVVDETAALKEEIERLKGLIEEGFKLLQRQWHKQEEQISCDWEKFKIENQL